MLSKFMDLLHSKQSLASEGFFVAEGKIIFERLLSSRVNISTVLCVDSLKAEMELVADSRWPVYSMPASEISSIAGFPFHRGVLTLGERPVQAELEHFLDSLPAEAILVACPAVTDEANLGSLIRNASALGASGVFLGSRSADPYSRRVIRTSMGNVFHLPLFFMDDEGTYAQIFKNKGFRVTGAALSLDSVDLNKYIRAPREVLVFGHESEGLPREWLERCDALVRIPMQNGTDSLNVMVSAGILLYALMA